MAEMDGLQLCERILEKRPGIPVIVVTGQGSMEAAIGAMQRVWNDTIPSAVLNVYKAHYQRTNSLPAKRNDQPNNDCSSVVVKNFRRRNEKQEIENRKKKIPYTK